MERAPLITGKRQRTSPDIDESENVNKKMKALFDGDQIAEKLKRLGNDIANVSDDTRETTQVMDIAFKKLQEDFNVVFSQAFNKAKESIEMRRQTRETSEAMAMQEQEELVQLARKLRTDFFNDMKKVTDRMTTELTIGQQALMYTEIMTKITNSLEEAYTSSQTQEPDHLARLSELASIMFSLSIQQLSVTLSNIYKEGPEQITKLAAGLAASGMLYNYVPAGARIPLEGIPYFGSLFRIINMANPELLMIQNSAATVTTIFYLLKNMGIDTTDSLQQLGVMSRETAKICSKTAGKFICSAVGTTVTGVQTGAKSVLEFVIDKLGNILTSEYQSDNLLASSQESGLSTLSQTKQSTTSVSSMMSIDSLFNTPIYNGGIDIASAATPPEIVSERFDVILMEDVSNPIIATEVEVASNPVVVGEVEQYFDSQISDLTEESSGTAHWSQWLFGQRSSGGKRRKSRRNMKQLKSRKGIKGRKIRTTKKGRKHHRTLKRYKFKSRR